MNSVTFDIETRKLAADVGGWDELKSGEGGASAVVLWDTTSGRPHMFDDNDLDQAVATLEDAPVVLSYNGVGFDIPVLEGLYGRQLYLKGHLDLLALIWDALGTSRIKGYALGDVGYRTLGVPKTEDSADAPMLAETGQFGRLFNYCLDDVCLTRALFQFAQEHGGIMDLNGDLLPLTLPDWFQEVKI